MTDATELPTTEEMANLAALIDVWQRNKLAIEQHEASLKELNGAVAKLETDLIPSLMASAGGIEKFTLADGTAITLKDELFASVTAANQQAAFAWLEEHGHGDVIKDELKLNLGRGELAQQRAVALIVAAEQNGVDDYIRKRAVHPGTLQALLKEQLAEGVEVPKEIFGVYQQRRAVIKLARK